MAPPVEGSRKRVPRSLLLHQPGGWQQAPAHWRTAPTPPLPLGWQPPLLVPGARQRAFRPTCSSIAPAPPLRAATGDLRFFLLPDLLSTAIPLLFFFFFVETRVILLLFLINLNRCTLCASSAHQLSQLSQRSLSAFVLAVSLVTDHAPESPLPSLSELPFHGGFYPVSTPITAIRHRCSSFSLPKLLRGTRDR